MKHSKMDKSGEERTSGIQVIARAASILRALEGNATGLTIGELAKVVELPRPTVQRIVLALQSERLLCGVGQDKRFGLGPGLFRLASSIHLDLADFAKPVMERLSQRVQESVNLLKLQDKFAICIEHVGCDHELQVIPNIGTKLPLYCTASGKALLAAHPDDEIKRLVGSPPWKAFTAKTLTSWTALSADLRKVCAGGFAYDIEEHADGICGISASVRISSGMQYALTIPVPAQRFHRKLGSFQPELGKAKKEIEKLIRDQDI
jgi:IclR family transcriptional regulator, acetate operon repressor